MARRLSIAFAILTAAVASPVLAGPAESAPSEAIAPAPATPDAPTESTDSDVIVDLEARVPPRWFTNMTDDWPLTPERWRRRMPRRCRTRGGYRDHCQGARLVPTPHGPAAELARRLGLGHRATALHLRHHRPFPEWIDAVADADPERALTFPVPDGRLGRGFGRTRTGAMRHRRHQGVDIGATEGTPILAARGGLVAYSNNEITGYGNAVMILHRDGYTTFYAHCRRTLVFAGQRVERGTPIAEVGHTGFAPAAHLHFEWRQRGWPRDPARHFRRAESE